MARHSPALSVARRNDQQQLDLIATDFAQASRGRLPILATVGEVSLIKKDLAVGLSARLLAYNVSEDGYGHCRHDRFRGVWLRVRLCSKSAAKADVPDRQLRAKSRRGLFRGYDVAWRQNRQRNMPKPAYFRRRALF